MLTESPILAYPQLDVEFVLDTDASSTGIGAVLSQQVNGQERVVAYFSRDHSALRWLLNFRHPEGQTAR